LALLLGPAFNAPCFAGGAGGASPFNFLFLDPNAGPAALGGAGVASAWDGNAPFYNPAGLGFLEKHEATFTHNQHVQGISQEYFGFVWDIGSDPGVRKKNREIKNDNGARIRHGWGMAFNILNYGSIKRTTLSNPDGAGLGKFEAKDFSIAAGYGRRVRDTISLGFSGRIIEETIDYEKVSAFAFDAGLMIKPEVFPVSFGLAVQNIGPRIKLKLERFELPLNAAAGAAWRFSKAGLIASAVNIPKTGGLTVHTGIEYSFFRTITLRAGYNGRNEASNGITFGGGLKAGELFIDYALISYGDIGNSNRLSLTYRFR